MGSINPEEDRCNFIFSQTFHQKKNHKYGIELPKTVEEAIKIDTNNGKNLCWDAIYKEILNVGIYFELIYEVEKLPPGCNKVSGHLVFDVNIDFTKKLRWFLDGYKTPYPIGSTYAGVVSR